MRTPGYSPDTIAVEPVGKVDRVSLLRTLGSHVT